jgi:hypothetical protein
MSLKDFAIIMASTPLFAVMKYGWKDMRRSMVGSASLVRFAKPSC